MYCPVCKTHTPGSKVLCTTCGAQLCEGENEAEISNVDFPNTDALGSTPALATGVTLQGGLYTLSEVLGRGGFGITYRGHDTSLNRIVAIKEFFPVGCQRQRHKVHAGTVLTTAQYQAARSRFVQEAHTLARFQQAGIVDIYAVFEENNTAYMVMEYLQGQTLQHLLEKSGALPESQAVEFVTKAGEALAAVHQAGLLHRDIKPENIMLCEGGRIALIDFGTAREFILDTTQQMTTAVTPGYAPLEQYGQQSRFGAFTDIYALGATLYHLLTGQPPVEAPDRAAGVVLESPTQLNPDVSRAVSETTMWALKNKAEDRPQAMREFLYSLANGTDAATSTIAVAAMVSTPPATPIIPTAQELTSPLASAPHVSDHSHGFENDDGLPSRRIPMRRWVFAVVSATLGLLGMFFWPRAQTAPIVIRSLRPTPIPPVPPVRSIVHKTPAQEAKLKQAYDGFIKTIDARLHEDDPMRNSHIQKHHPNEFMFSHPSDISPLFQALEVKTLCDTGKIEVLPSVTRFLGEPDPLVRDAAGYSLAQLVSERIASNNLRQHKDHSRIVDGGTHHSDKINLRPLAWVILHMLKQPPDNMYHSYAAEMIGSLGLRDFEPELRELLQSENSTVRKAARRALLQLGLKVGPEKQAARSAALSEILPTISPTNPPDGLSDQAPLIISKTTTQQAKLKRSYDDFIKALDISKIIRSEPRVIKDLQSLNPYIKVAAVKNVLEKAQSINRVDKIRLLAPLTESSEPEVRVWAVTTIKQLISDTVMERRDMRFPTQLVIKPRRPQDPDLSPLAWTVLQLLKSSRTVPNDRVTLGYAAEMIGYLQLREFEPELQDMVKKPYLGSTSYASQTLNMLHLKAPKQ